MPKSKRIRILSANNNHKKSSKKQKKKLIIKLNENFSLGLKTGPIDSTQAKTVFP